MIKLLDLVSKMRFCVSTSASSIGRSSCWTWLAFFNFKEKRNRNDHVAGLGLQFEILCFDISVLNSQSSCWTWLGFIIFQEKRNRNDQVAGLGLQNEILCFDISVLN